MAPPLPENVQSRAHGIIAAAIVCSILSTLFVALRIWTRVFVNRSIGWDDYTALITLPLTIAYGVLLGISTRFGMGLHVYDFPPGLKDDYSKWIFIASCLYWISLLGYKWAILLLYLRIFNVSRPFRYITWAVMFMVFGYLFSNFAILLGGCTPMAKYWNPNLSGGCINEIAADYGIGALNFISDLIMFILPLPMIWKLHLSTRQKVGVAIVLMSGSINWIVAIVRFACAVEDLTSADRTWLAAKTFLWSILEVNTGLMCACVPILNSFINHYLPKEAMGKSWRSFRTKTTSRSWSSSHGHSDHKTSISHKSFIELERGKSRGQGDSDKDLVRSGNTELALERGVSDEEFVPSALPAVF